jgi:DNA-binding NarL/FixJ family response regulator
MRVFVADHRALIRQGVISIVAPVYPNWLFRQAGSLAEVKLLLADRAAPASPVLLIVERAMLGDAAAEAIAALRSLCGMLKVVVLGDADAPASLAGADRRLVTHASVDELLEALRPFAGIDGMLMRRPFSAIAPLVASDSSRVLPWKLTPRQQQVLGLLMNGQSTKDIARSLNLGLGTVKVHLNGIYRSLGARNRNEAVAWSRTQGFPAAAARPR